MAEEIYEGAIGIDLGMTRSDTYEVVVRVQSIPANPVQALPTHA